MKKSNLELMIKNNKGITLIALVITIIVMLILVGVTITIGANGGLFDSAKKAKNETLFKAEQESLQNLVFGRNNAQDGVVDLVGLKEDLDKSTNEWKNVQISTEETPELLTVIGVKSERIHSVAKDGTISEVPIGKAKISITIEGVGTAEGAETYDTNTEQTLKAIAGSKKINETNVEYEFVGWYKDGTLVSESEECKITVIEDATYTVKFRPKDCSLIYYLNENNEEQIIISTKTTLSKSDWSPIEADKITKIEIGRNCTNIGNNAFDGCSGIESVTAYTTNILKIGNYAFRNCTGLLNVDLPNSDFSTYEGLQFLGCTNLENATIGSKGSPLKVSSNQMFNGCKKSNLIIKAYVEESKTNLISTFGNTATIEYYSATSGELINVILGQQYKGTDVNFASIPNADKITVIRGSAFEGCTSLELTSLPSNLVTIEARAFYGCEKLKIAEIPSTCTSIGDSAFENCNGLTEITANTSNTINIGAYAFKNCQNVRNIKFANVKFSGYPGGYFQILPSLEYLQLGSIGNGIPANAIGTMHINGSTNINLVVDVYIKDETQRLSTWGNNAIINYYNESGVKIET